MPDAAQPWGRAVTDLPVVPPDWGSAGVAGVVAAIAAGIGMLGRDFFSFLSHRQDGRDQANFRHDLLADVQRLERKVGGLEGQVATYETQVGSLTDQVTEQKNQVSHYRGRVTVLTKQVQTYELGASDLTQQVFDLKGANVRILEQVRTDGLEHARLTARVVYLERRNTRLTGVLIEHGIPVPEDE